MFLASRFRSHQTQPSQAPQRRTAIYPGAIREVDCGVETNLCEFPIVSRNSDRATLSPESDTCFLCWKRDTDTPFPTGPIYYLSGKHQDKESIRTAFQLCRLGSDLEFVSCPDTPGEPKTWWSSPSFPRSKESNLIIKRPHTNSHLHVFLRNEPHPHVGHIKASLAHLFRYHTAGCASSQDLLTCQGISPRLLDSPTVLDPYSALILPLGLTSKAGMVV